MRIIIAPAKKMVVDTDSFAVDNLPEFLERTERLKTVLQGMSPKDLQALRALRIKNKTKDTNILCSHPKNKPL